MPRMDDSELKAIVDAEIQQSLGYLSSELSEDRIDGWNAYLKEPYGNEIEGRSSVVSSDVQDTVEWIMPNLIRIFTAGDNAVEFTPHGPEDEEQAKQATDYCNYVWDKDNPGFLNFYTWFKDALIAKTGVVKVYWEQKDKWKRESYYGLDDNAYGMLIADEGVEVVEHTETQVVSMDEMGQPVPSIAHDVVVKVKETVGKICVEPVPPEEVLFSRDSKDVQSGRFFGHRRKRTVSDLIEAYPDKRKVIESLSSDEPSGDRDAEAIARSSVDEEEHNTVSSVVNQAMREVWVTEGYIRVDYDGDGIAEMRKVTVAGASSEILDNEEWGGLRPFALISPILMPHRLVGLSIADLIKDLQLIKTAVLRQYLDALYIANNPRQEVVEDLIIDPAEVLTSKPNGIVRVKGNGAVPAIRPIPVTPISAQALEGLNYIDQLRENRTGVSPRTQGLGADALHDTAAGEQLMFSQAQSRIELIARVFAETGVKDAFKLILWNASRYQDKARTIRLRNQWVDMDPRQWSTEYDMSVNVGLGNGDKTQQLMALRQVLALQMQAVQFQGGVEGPFVTAENLHNSATKLVEAAGLKGPELYFTDPRTAPPQEPKPDPKMMEVQGKMQLEQQKTQAQMMLDQQKSAMDMEAERMKLEQEMALKREQMQIEFALKREEMAMEMQLKREQMALDAQIRERDSMRQASVANVQQGGEVG